MDRPESPNRVCAVCRSKASQICGGCGEVSYCAKEHQKQHWPLHKSQCKPYKIVVDPKFGRCMVATKNLKAGEIIFREKAAISGPKQGCLPLCLTCYTSLENVQEADLFRCSGCNFPFCQERCAKDPGHEAECAVLSRAKTRTTIKDMTQSHPVYQCISPLRALLLKTTQPKLFESFSGLQHHNELRRETDLWRVYQVNVVDFLRNVCGLADQFSEEEIHAACGALDVNAFEIRLPVTGQRVLGAFLLASMMAHRCVSNISHVIDSNYQMTVRASLPIQRGEQIYASYALSLDGTKERRAILRLSKFFECDCYRCSDPTEVSTFMSALRCQKCGTGVVLPVRPLDEQETEWRCHLCTYRLTSTVVNRVIDRLKEEFESIGPNEVDKYEGFLSRHARVLHPNHFLFTSAKQSLSQLYGRDEHHLLNTLTEKQLERKVAICRELLAIANVVEPGLTRLRGVTLYEMHAPMLLLARRAFEAGQSTSSELKEKIEGVRVILAEATRILSLEDPASSEGAMATAAVQALDQIQRWISSL